ncbi:MAG: hypothetical protein ABJO36_02345 [Litorimonas sp.]
MTYLKSTYLPTLSIASALLLSACGGGGGGSSSTPTPPTPPVADTTAPALAFSPSRLSVESEATGSSTLTATDAVGITVGPTVDCTNGGSFDVATNTFTAATVTADTESVCTATASDAAGNEGTATLTVTMTVPVPDTTAPVVTFNPATLSVESGQTGSSNLTATDDTAVTTGPTVSCTNGGSFNVATNVFTAATVTANTESVCTATASDAAGNEGTGTLTVTMTPAPVSMDVIVSGKLTYDRVPLNTTTSALNYDAIVQSPIRQAPVELLNASGTVLQSTVSDDNGDYSFTVESGQDVRVRVRSEIQKGAPNEIDLQVVDNTSDDALYALQGALSEVPTANQTRNLNAASGWGGSSYTTTRAAAPFALLDTIYTAIEGFIAVDADVDFPKFNVLWSTRNRPSTTIDVDNGDIGTSSFTIQDGIPVLRILGAADNDTDEYDVHVVVHEFGHYFENQLSRSDSIGGQHSSSNRLDARVAFGEGWGNALSGMILDDPFYRDSFGARQGSGFNINVENNTYTSTGWYSEGSVQSILYDLFDDTDDGADTASYGLAPIYGAFTDPDYESTSAFTSIFAFLEALDNQSGITTSEITALTDAQNINGTNGFGIGETNNGGLTDALPVYLLLQTNNTPVEFCSVDNFGTFNKHGNRRYLAFNIPTAGTYTFTMARSSGAATSDPDFRLFKDGVFVGRGESGVVNTETQNISLTAGQHVMEAYAFENVDGTSTIDVCYTMTLRAQ